MTFPCIDEDHFEMVNGTHVRPLDYMQWRHVATAFANGNDQSLAPYDGTAKNILIHTLQAQWVNTTPLPQKVYGLLTRGGSTVVITARSRAYLQINSGTVSGVAPADPSLSVILSRFGCGADRGTEILGNPRYTVIETRAGERTSLIGGTNTVAPGETVKVKAELRFISENWESVVPYGGAGETEARFSSGATQIDLFAYPSL